MKRAYVILAPVAGSLIATAVVASAVYYTHTVDTAFISSFIFSILAVVAYMRNHTVLATAFAVSAVLLAVYPFMQKPKDAIQTLLGAGVATINGKTYILGMNTLGIVLTVLPVVLLLISVKNI